MLKFFIPLIMLIWVHKEWKVVQLGVGVLAFSLSLSCFHNFFMYNVGHMFGMDYLSYIMVVLSVWIVFLVLLASESVKSGHKFHFSFIMVNLILLLFLVATFSSISYLIFYISFEASLIPTLILILGWGYQPERIQAGIYMLFYTLTLSLPLLVCLLNIYYEKGSLIMKMSELSMSSSYMMSIWYMFVVLAFLVKLPMYMFHLWLPKAHVEAPVAGSMILAGILLKLGGYGLFRVLIMFQLIGMKFSNVWMSMGLMGGFIISLVCLRQVDVKSLIAYSSVVHMGLVLCGLMIYNWWGLMGAVVVMIGHGLCSSGLFSLANMVYERVGSRSLLLSKGLLNFMPSMAMWWFILSISNMAAPPSLNMLGEISLIIGMISWSEVSVIGIMLISFFSAAYTLYMYSLSQHGLFYNSLYACCSGKVREYMLLFLHWAPLNILIFNMKLVNMV
uniref:NADH-ubiquinone oxidoreductase chain 4 n=1 Tax=Longpotamon kenliense TaxID=1775323 RepID=A0A517LT68_9EUCA|nr:NADH dehydrogenase subunit 4 [Longpotamon kenliense]YP_011036582.1 NADH dehydrogenase subunit 4 [Longpotamon loudiense]QDS78827.1 NADH dehydrogenase subunit 4 [Longpotamon kenliense]WRK19544.1 NADH dehydrogenase subunit 4 [Longpotamon loudiense]